MNERNQNERYQESRNANQVYKNRTHQNIENQNQRRADSKNQLPANKKKNNAFGRRVAALLLAATALIGGIVTTIKNRINDGNDLPEEPETVETGEQIKDNFSENTFEKDLKVKVDLPSEVVEFNNLSEEIDKINSKEDILEWFKEFYVSKYEGDFNISKHNIKFVKSKHVNLIQAGDNLVTRGSYPQITKNDIIQDGQTIEYISQSGDFSIFSIQRDYDSKIQDCITYRGGKIERVIPGDSYNEMKEYDSTLVKMKNIPQFVMEIYSLEDELEEKPGNEYLSQKINTVKNSLKEELKEVLMNSKDSQVSEKDEQYK